MSRYLTAGLLLLAAAVLVGCGKSTAPEEQTAPTGTAVQETSVTLQTAPDTVRADGQLIASAETREEAQAIADQYGITLVDWGYGGAKFYTVEDPREVIRRGQEKGWPELYPNNTVQAFGEK